MWPGSITPVLSFVQSDAIRPDPSFVIPISASDTLTVEIAAILPPSSIEAEIWISIPDNFIEKIILEPGLTAPVTFDLEGGTYLVRIIAEWSNTIDSDLVVGGVVAYAFRIEIDSA